MSTKDRIVRRKSRLSLLLSTFTIVFAWVAWTLLAEKSSSTVRKFSSSSSQEEDGYDEATNESDEEEEEEESIERDFSENSRRDHDLAKNSDAIHYDSETIDEDRSTVARCYGLLNDIDSRIGQIFLRIFGGKNRIQKNGTIDDDDDDYDATRIVDSDDS